MKEYKTHSDQETKEIAKRIAEQLVNETSLMKGALVIGLRGELGAGKTTFVQGFAEYLGVKEIISSPTFVIVKEFPLEDGKFRRLYHIDCYRLQNEKDILALDWQEIINNPEHIVLVEWPERIAEVMPKNAMYLDFESIAPTERKITVTFLW